MGISDRLLESAVSLPVLVRLLFFPFFVLAFGLYCMLMAFEYVLLMALLGGAVYVLSFMASANPFLQVFGASLGSLIVLSSIAAVYVKSGFHLSDGGLKILDWLFIIMTAVMMGCFQWIGADPLYWVLFVVFPMLGVRIVICCIVNNRKRCRHGKK